MIGTHGVNLDSNPGRWLADERVQTHLPAEHLLAYINLIHYAHTLTATTGSEYVDGEFSFSTALKRVRHLTESALDAMLDADLVAVIDGDRWWVDSITPQSTHAKLQQWADARDAGKETRAANRAAKAVAQDVAADATERRREQDRERKRKSRAGKAAKEIAAPAQPVSLTDVGKAISERGTYNPAPRAYGDYESECAGCDMGREHCKDHGLVGAGAGRNVDEPPW